MYLIVNGNAVNIGLRSKSVHCVVTSPPYWGLRDYGLPPTDWPAVSYAPLPGCPAVTIPPMRCCLGLETTPEAFVGHVVAVFREVWRVLRDDGTVWLNFGDTYAANRGYQVPDSKYCDVGNSQGMKAATIGLKPKDLVGIPWRVALALQADGWYLRSDIIWAKTNPMPESVIDRPTKAHEYLFLLTKRARYFYDAEAVKEEAQPASVARMARGVSDNHKNINGAPGQTPHSMNQPRPNRSKADSFKEESDWDTSSRNRRSVWQISTKPYREAHFAVFPEDLVEPCILAGTSARGVCPQCGAGWVRLTEKRKGQLDSFNGSSFNNGKSYEARAALAEVGTSERTAEVVTIGWGPGCRCGSEATSPAVVFDPFSGSGTAGRVAIRLGRRFVGNELNPAYIDLAGRRVDKVQIEMGF